MSAGQRTAAPLFSNLFHVTSCWCFEAQVHNYIEGERMSLQFICHRAISKELIRVKLETDFPERAVTLASAMGFTAREE